MCFRPWFVRAIDFRHPRLNPYFVEWEQVLPRDVDAALTSLYFHSSFPEEAAFCAFVALERGPIMPLVAASKKLIKFDPEPDILSLLDLSCPTQPLTEASNGIR